MLLSSKLLCFWPYVAKMICVWKSVVEPGCWTCCCSQFVWPFLLLPLIISRLLIGREKTLENLSCVWWCMLASHRKLTGRGTIAMQNFSFVLMMPCECSNFHPDRHYEKGLQFLSGHSCLHVYLMLLLLINRYFQSAHKLLPHMMSSPRVPPSVFNTVKQSKNWRWSWEWAYDLLLRDLLCLWSTPLLS